MIIFDLNNSQHCYILGFFWADSCLSCKQGRRSFSFEISNKDFQIVWPILQEVGFEKFSTRKRLNSSNLQSVVRASKIEDVGFLIENGFVDKSGRCQLYFKLSEEMKKFFVKGFLDGDGSISLDKNGLFRVGFNGPKYQNWEFLEDFCEKNHIKFRIYRKDRKSHHKSHVKPIHQYSIFEFTNLQDRINICSILNVDVGLTRKISIFKEYKEFRIKKQLTSKIFKQLYFP